MFTKICFFQKVGYQNYSFCTIYWCLFVEKYHKSSKCEFEYVKKKIIFVVFAQIKAIFLLANLD